MTVNTTDIVSGPYTGNGVADSFSYTFRISDKTQLIVYETTEVGVETELTVDTDYTVAGIGVDGGGILTRVAGALPTGYTWYIRSNYIENQLTAFASQGGFFPDVHEGQMDHLTFLIQQLRDSIDRSLRFPDSYSGGTVALLPLPDPFKLMRWNSAGTGLENTAAIDSPDSQTVTRERTIATAGQTVFTTVQTISGIPGHVSVVMGGSQLGDAGDEFTVTGPNEVTLTVPALLNQIVDIYIGALIPITQNAPDVSYTPATGPTTDVAAALDNEVWLTPYAGVDPSGTTDSAPGLIAAIAGLPDSGGVIRVADGNFRLDSEIVVNKMNVTIICKGQGGDQNGISGIRDSAATRFFRGGSSTAPLFTFESSGNPKICGGIRGCMLDGMNLASRVLQVLSYRNLEFKDMFIYGATGTNIFMGATGGVLTFAPYDSQHNNFDNVWVSNRNLGGTAKAMVLSGGQGAGATVGGNSSFNVFNNCNFESNNTHNDVVLEDTDNNYFFGCRIDQLRLSSGDEDSSGNDSSARFNTFVAGEIKKAFAGASQTGGGSSFSNTLIGVSLSNGAGLPTIQAGAGGANDAVIYFHTNSGVIGPDLFLIKESDAGTIEPGLILRKDSTAGFNGMGLAKIQFRMTNDAGTKNVDAGRFDAAIIDATAGSETARVGIHPQYNGNSETQAAMNWQNGVMIDDGVTTVTPQGFGTINVSADYYARNLQGYTGTFTEHTGKTVTVTGGIITSVV